MAPAKRSKGEASARMGASMHKSRVDRLKRMVQELYHDGGVSRAEVRASLLKIRDLLEEAIEGIDQEI